LGGYGFPSRPFLHELSLYDPAYVDSHQLYLRPGPTIRTPGSHPRYQLIAPAELIFDVEVNIWIKLMEFLYPRAQSFAITVPACYVPDVVSGDDLIEPRQITTFPHLQTASKYAGWIPIG